MALEPFRGRLQVYIAGHIPPVVSSVGLNQLWDLKFSLRYWNLVATWGDDHDIDIFVKHIV